jgi:hypothetical protein
MKVYVLRYPTISGDRVVTTDLKKALADARAALTEWHENDEPLTFVISTEAMTEETYAALAEHEGWS